MKVPIEVMILNEPRSLMAVEDTITLNHES